MFPDLPRTEAEALLVLATALHDKWCVGSFSRFCDEPPDFDDASPEEIVQLLEETLRKSGWTVKPVA